MPTQNIYSIQSDKYKTEYSGLNLKQYLHEGINKIEIQLAAGFEGGFYVEFQFSQKAGEKYICSDTTHICSQGKSARIIDGVQLEKDCWQYRYTKTCQYPSRDDCAKLNQCYFVADKECLLKDYYANCVNMKKEYSCKTPKVFHKVKRSKIDGIPINEKGSGLKCNNFPYDPPKNDVDGDMPQVISQLSSLMQYKGLKGTNPIQVQADIKKFKVFNGSLLSCNKMITNYKNCCRTQGWGQQLFGVGCSNDEKTLSELRSKRLCKYVGKKHDTLGPLTFKSVHYFCCFNSTLDRIIQTQARKRPFGYAANADCTGLTLDEMREVNWNGINFKDFEAEILEKVNLSNLNDLGSRIKNSVNTNIKSDSNSEEFGVNQKLKHQEEKYHK